MTTSPAKVSVADEVDGYERSVRGAHIRAIRTGRGTRPNRVGNRLEADYVATWVTTGFPMLTTATLPDDALTVALITHAPPGSKWRDIELESGAVLLYGQGAQHTAVNPEGISFVFASVDTDAVRASAERSGVTMRWPAAAVVEELPRSHTHALGLTLRSLAASQPHLAPRTRASDLLPSLAHALDECRLRDRPGACRRINDADVVAACVEYAEVIDRVPSLAELCSASYVCERKLRNAFNAMFNTSPARYFRAWGLDRAHRRLRVGDVGEVTVTNVANDLGFAHAGRFARTYAARYGEPPSRTLRRSP